MGNILIIFVTGLFKLSNISRARKDWRKKVNKKF